jgi:hypothetical protein
MKIILILCLVFLAGAVSAQELKETRYFELRIYYAASGKLDALISRFSNHTTKLFEKHGMTNIGYWVPVNNEKNALYYILAYPDKEARKKSWDAFNSDPDWKKVVEESQKNGKLIDSIKSVYMYQNDILDGIKPASPGSIFELRTYYCFPNRLPNLVTRFKDHTVGLFEKHGMQNIVYFTTEDSNLLYLLAHKSQDAAKKSWDDFRADPDWIKAKEASEKDGKIVDRVESVYMKPLPFSNIK